MDSRSGPARGRWLADVTLCVVILLAVLLVGPAGVAVAAPTRHADLTRSGVGTVVVTPHGRATTSRLAALPRGAPGPPRAPSGDAARARTPAPHPGHTSRPDTTAPSIGVLTTVATLGLLGGAAIRAAFWRRNRRS